MLVLQSTLACLLKLNTVPRRAASARSDAMLEQCHLPIDCASERRQHEATSSGGHDAHSIELEPSMHNFPLLCYSTPHFKLQYFEQIEMFALSCCAKRSSLSNVLACTALTATAPHTQQSVLSLTQQTSFLPPQPPPTCIPICLCSYATMASAAPSASDYESKAQETCPADVRMFSG